MDGSAFDPEVAARAAASMTGTAMEDDEVKAIGAQGVWEIAERADALMRAGVDQTLVVAWPESAADAFSAELSRAAGLLTAPPAAASRQ